MEIVYKKLAGCSLYRFGTDGSAWSLYNNKWGIGEWKRLKGWKYDEYGHIGLDIKRDDGTCRKGTIHGFVLEAHVGPRPAGKQCRHLNGIAWDNRLENLKWGTPQEDRDDMVRHGTSTRGVRNHHAKLDDRKVVIARCLRESGYKLRELCDIFKVAMGIMSMILNRKLWKHTEDVKVCVSYLVEEGHWERKGKTNVVAPEFDHDGSEEKLVQLIESEGREKELRLLVNEVWSDVEEQCSVSRKNRYS